MPSHHPRRSRPRLGIPGGLVLGTHVWHLGANNLGVTTAAAVSTFGIPIALTLINLLAYFHGRAPSTHPTRNRFRTE